MGSFFFFAHFGILLLYIYIIISAILFHVDLVFVGFTSICLGSNTIFERF